MNEASQSRSGRTPPEQNAKEVDSAGADHLPDNSLIELINLQWRRERSDLDLSNFLLAIYCMRLGTLVERTYDRMCQKHYDISGSDMRVLLALRRGGHPYAKRPTDLFRALLVTSGAITKKVDRLAAAGLVERLPDPVNNAGFLVHLTRKGLHLVDEATERLARQSALAPAMSGFTKGERDAGTRFVLRTLATLEANHLDEVAAEETAEAHPPAAKKGVRRSKA